MIMFIIAGIMAFLIAGGCFIGCLVAVIRQYQNRKGSLSTSGEVVGLEKRIFNPGSAGVYCPTVEFTTANGAMVRFESSFGTMPASNKVGDHVKVFYRPEKPDAAEIDSGITRWFVPGCLFLFSMGSCFFSALFLGLFIVYSNTP
jgi:hypothetical protein